MMMKSDRSFSFLLIAVLLSRIPLLSGGFGADGDAWRVAKSALMMWNEGIYHVSRFPGFPVYEFLQTPVIALGGSLASNCASLLVFMVSIVIFRKIIRYWNVPNADLLLISYAFLPILWKNSAVTMDYVWGLLGILTAFYLLLTKKIFLAGIILGLSVGIRMTHIAYILPCFLLFAKNERKQWWVFALTAAGTAAVCYLPVLWSEDYFRIVQDFLKDAGRHSLFRRIGFFFYRLVFSLGAAGWFFIIAVLTVRMRKIPGVLRTPEGMIASAFCVTGVAVFAVLQDEREYLIPMFPFLLILLSHIADRKQFIVIAAALVSFGFISFDVIEHGVEHPRVDLRIRSGYLVNEYTERREIHTKRLQLARAPVKDSSFIMIGMGPMFWLDNPSVMEDRKVEKEFRHDCARSADGREVYYIYALYKPQLDEIRRRGYHAYYWDEMKGYLHTFIGYDLDEGGIRSLRIP